MEPVVVPPSHLLKRRNFYLGNACPPSAMNELILVGTVDVLGQGIVIGETDCPGGRSDPVLG